MVSRADRVILALLGVLIRSPSEKLKRYYASPYLPDAISDNRNIRKLVYRISGLFQLIQLLEGRVRGRFVHMMLLNHE